MTSSEARAEVVKNLRAHLTLEAKTAQDPEVRKAASTMLAALNSGKPLVPADQLPPHE